MDVHLHQKVEPGSPAFRPAFRRAKPLGTLSLTAQPPCFLEGIDDLHWVQRRRHAKQPSPGASRRMRPAAPLPALALAILLLLGSRVAPAQDLSFMAHAAWSTEEGLPQASVHAIFQAADGYLWVATEGGAARFDGAVWKSYTHETSPAFTSDDVSSIAEAPAGVLWFGTSDGLVRMAGGAVRHLDEADGLPSPSILSLVAADGGALLVVTTGGLARVDRDGVHRVPGSRPSFTSAERTADGVVWLLGGESCAQYKTGSVVPANLPVLPGGGGSTQGVAAGPNGALWLRSATRAFLVAGGARRGVALPAGAAGARLQTLWVDRNGTAWIGTNHGLFLAGAAAPSNAKPVPALGAESILSLFGDREGNIWIGGENSGVHVLRPRSFRAEPATLGTPLTAVVGTGDGLLWFGTRDEGLGSLRPDGTAAHPSSSLALTSPVILSLAPGNHGDVWAGTPDGLNHIDHGTVHTYTSAEGLPDNFVRSVLVSRDDSVWIGTRYGLAHLAGGAGNTLTHTEGLASDSVGPLLGAGGSDLWIGTAAGLAKRSGGRVQNFPAPGSPHGGVVTALAHDTGDDLWVAMHGDGLSHFAHGVFHPVGLPGLPEEISALAVDPTGHLWLRGKRGLYRASASALRACAQAGGACRATVDRYGVPDGLPSDESAAEGSPSLWGTSAGLLWLATRKGLAVADTLHFPVNIVPPPLVLQRFAVDDVEQPLSGPLLRIGSGHRSFTFEYAALSYTMPSGVRYRYKLEGFDRDWIDAGTRRTAYYTSLPGRRYRFRVIAANNDGLWNPTGADLPFSVQPPLYLRWWFYLLLVLLLSGAVALAFQLRLRRVRGEFALVLNERNRVAREIHDTLAQDFVSVSLQLELVSGLVRGGKLAQATEQIAATRSLVRKGLEAARQSIWDLRANVAGNALPVRLRKAMEDFAGAHPDAQVKVGGAYRPLDRATENEVLRIAGESLSNIDRHAPGARVTVDLRYGPEQLALVVRDDGPGFSPAAALAKPGHYGLRGMQERALALGGRLTIASNPGEGTTVTLTVPLDGGEGS